MPNCIFLIMLASAVTELTLVSVSSDVNKWLYFTV